MINKRIIMLYPLSWRQFQKYIISFVFINNLFAFNFMNSLNKLNLILIGNKMINFLIDNLLEILSRIYRTSLPSILYISFEFLEIWDDDLFYYTLLVSCFGWVFSLCYCNNLIYFLRSLFVKICALIMIIQSR